MALKVLYQTKQKSEDRNQLSYKITYQGLESQIDAYIATLSIGTTQAEGCYLASWTKSQFGADRYQLELNYTKSYEWGSYSNVPPTVVGKKSAVLSVRNIQLPLQHLDNYLVCWNNFLIQKATSKSETEQPAWWATLGKDADGQIETIPDAYSDEYMIIKSLSERPTGKEDGKTWYVVAYPTKPGVQYYDWAVFVVTESAAYRTASAAGSAVDKNINTITAPSNTFGLNWGDWKLDQATVQYDGKAWISSCTYTHSGDQLGWDRQIYQ